MVKDVPPQLGTGGARSICRVLGGRGWRHHFETRDVVMADLLGGISRVDRLVRGTGKKQVPIRTFQQTNPLTLKYASGISCVGVAARSKSVYAIPSQRRRHHSILRRRSNPHPRSTAPIARGSASRTRCKGGNPGRGPRRRRWQPHACASCLGGRWRSWSRPRQVPCD